MARSIPRKGTLIVISSPSGGGKTTVIGEVRKRRPELGYSISCTTRDPRPGEVDGINYIFLSEEEFRKRIDQGDFLEWEWVHGYRYGTLKDTVKQALERGQSLLFDIDVHGAKSLQETFPANSLLIFLKPPDLETLRGRLKSRAQDSQDEIDRRLKRLDMEMESSKEFDVIVVNDVLEDTVNKVIEAIDLKLKDGVIS